MKRFSLLASLSLILSGSVFAQIGGKSNFAFLNMNASSRQVALGTNFVSVFDNDISQAWNNPAILNEQMHNHAFASFKNYVSDIKGGYFSYGRHFKKLGTFSANVLYMDYGKFDGYTEAGIATGTFTAQDQCFSISYGNSWREKYRVGASLKYIYSIYESFVSNGLSTDISAMYLDTAKQLNITAYARNIGYQVIPYSGSPRMGLPFELAVSISKRLEHLPFRYHLIFNNLQRPDMRYTITETNQKDENGDNKVQVMTMGDNILRHLALGGELNLSKHFVLRFGYNHMMRKEMTQDQRKGMAGFSWGLGFRIKKFHLSYGSGSYFAGINSNQFSLLFNLSEFYKK